MKKNDFAKEEKERKTILHFRPIFFAFMFLLIGIIFARKIYYGDLIYIILTIAIFLILLLYSLYHKKFFIGLICLFVFACGNGMYFLSISPFESLPNYSEIVSVVGRLRDDIAYYGVRASVTLEDVKINGESASNIILYVDNVEELKTGDTVVFESIPIKEPLFEFNSFRNNYVRDGVVYSCAVDMSEIKVFEGKLKLDENIRQTIKETLLSSMSEENAYIAYAVLTGEKSGIDDEIYGNYNASGMLHILTVSGLHVGIFASCITFILKLCKAKKWLNFVLTAVILLFYSYICGFAPSVLRASVMYLVFLLSFLLGGQYDSLSSIGLAGIILAFINPLYVFDAGFLMSFFSVIFIAILFRPLSRQLMKIFPKVVAQTMSMSIVTMIGTLPFVASFYSNFNFLSIFANLIAVPFFSIAFVLLFVFLIISLILPFMNFLLAISDGSFYVLNFIAKFYSNNILSIPLTPLYEGISVSAFLMIYSLSDFVMLSLKPRAILSTIFACFFIIFCALSFIPNKNKESEVYYLYSYSFSEPRVYIKSKSGQSLLIDFEENLRTYKFLNYVRYKNIDYFLSLSKPDEDFLSFLNERGIKACYYFEENDEGNEDFSILTDCNKTFEAGDFKFCFYKSEDNYLGVRVEFDNKSIFFAKSKELSYNESVYLSENVESVDCLFTNDRLDFLDVVKSKKTFSLSYLKETNFCYSGNGNLKILLSDEIKVRNLG